MQYCASSRHGGIRFPWKKSFITLVALSVLIPRIGSCQSGLTVNFINKNPDYGPAQIYVAFGGQSNPAQLVGTIVNGAGLSLGANYALAHLKTRVQLTRFICGRICFSLGKPFRSLKPGNANNPNFNNPSLPDFNIRWDKAEITYDVGDPHNGINLSATDFFGVRLKIQTYHAGSLVTTLTWQAPIATIFHKTGLLTGFSRDAVCLDDKNGVPTEGLTPRNIIKVVRVIAPATIPAAVVKPYPTLHTYIHLGIVNSFTTTIIVMFIQP